MRALSSPLSPSALIFRFFSLVDYNLLIYMRPLHTRMPQGLPGYGLRAQGYGLWVTRPEGTRRTRGPGGRGLSSAGRLLVVVGATIGAASSG